MASINKLSIRGVRSFSPDEGEQVLQFFFPCTIIVGANGCGKTTIIECLKYAATGALPPGVRSGSSFVHDPKSVGQSTVKANVKLRFSNKAGAEMVVVRSMEVTQKKTNLTFKQSDGVLRTIDQNTGDRVSLSHKCSELDRILPPMLGLSKAVLESVIFCHQEESSWPLQEGAVLKKQFDAIFDSARYTKALDNFRKTKKDLNNDSKELKAEVAGLASHQHAAREFQQDLKKQVDLSNKIEDDRTEALEKRAKAERTNEEYGAIVDQVKAVDAQIADRKSKLLTLRSVQENHRKILEEDLTTKHSQREIKEMLRDFDKDIEQQKERYDELNEEYRSIQNDVEQLRQEEMKLNSSKGKFAAEKDAQDQRLKERFLKMDDLAQRYSVELQSSMTQQSRLDMSIATGAMGSASQVSLATVDTGVPEISQEDLDAFFQSVNKKEDELRDNLKSHKVRIRAQEDELQGALTELVGKKNTMENERTKLSKERDSIDKEIQELDKSFNKRGHNSKADLEEARRKATAATKELEKLGQDKRREEIPSEIRSLETKIDELKRKIEDDQAVQSELRHHLETEQAMGVLEEQARQDILELQENIKDMTFDLGEFKIPFPEISPNDDAENINRVIDKTYDDVQDKFEAAKQDLGRAEKQVSDAQQKYSQIQAEALQRKATIRSLKERKEALNSAGSGYIKIRSVLDAAQKDNVDIRGWSIKNGDPQELLSSLEKKIKETEEDSMQDIKPESVKKIMKKIKKLGKDKETCPCCTRKFSAADELDAFLQAVKDLAISSETSPFLQQDNEAEQKNRHFIEKLQKWRTTFSSSTSDLLEFRRVSKELKEIEPTYQALERSFDQAESALNDAKSEVSSFQTEVEKLRNLSESSKRWRDASSRIAVKQNQVGEKHNELTNATSMTRGGGRDLKSVERDISTHQDDKDIMTNKINKLNKEMTSINNAITTASTKATNTSDRLRQLEQTYGKQEEAKNRRRSLQERKGKIAGEESKISEDMAPLRQKIKAKESEKRRLQAHSAEEEEKVSDTLNRFLSDVKHLNDLSEKINDYNANSGSSSLDQIELEVAKVVGRIKEKKKQLEKLSPNLEQAAKAVDDQERQKKLLKDNLGLLNNISEMKDLEKEISQLKEEKNGIAGHETALEGALKASQVMNKCEATLQLLQGRTKEVAEQIRHIRRKLMTPEYKDIDERYRVANIKLNTTNIAVKDLEKYIKALDNALLRFHGMKIAEINKIVKELWTLTYKGEDITNIEIVSGEEQRAAKSYNYRVVMTKGNTKMDMRGRCSAGQRVLASLVIRLALAETFGTNCGVIALDEPTVNLDHDNKRGLAIALAQIIAIRSKQRNFQLILITHDEDFVGMMKTELSSQTGFPMPEKYFQVRREQAGDGKFYSKIDAIDWDELL